VKDLIGHVWDKTDKVRDGLVYGSTALAAVDKAMKMTRNS